MKLLYEIVATGTTYSDTLSIDDSSTCAQLFVGNKNLTRDVHGMKLDNKKSTHKKILPVKEELRINSFQIVLSPRSLTE